MHTPSSKCCPQSSQPAALSFSRSGLHFFRLALLRLRYGWAVFQLALSVAQERHQLSAHTYETLKYDLGIDPSAAQHEVHRGLWDLPEKRLVALRQKYGVNRL